MTPEERKLIFRLRKRRRVCTCFALILMFLFGSYGLSHFLVDVSSRGRLLQERFNEGIEFKNELRESFEGKLEPYKHSKQHAGEESTSTSHQTRTLERVVENEELEPLQDEETVLDFQKFDVKETNSLGPSYQQVLNVSVSTDSQNSTAASGTNEEDEGLEEEEERVEEEDSEEKNQKEEEIKEEKPFNLLIDEDTLFLEEKLSNTTLFRTYLSPNLTLNVSTNSSLQNFTNLQEIEDPYKEFRNLSG